MLTLYKNAEKLIGLTQEDADAVLSYILSEYRRVDGREEQGVDWVDIISEVMDEKNIASKKSNSATDYLNTIAELVVLLSQAIDIIREYNGEDDADYLEKEMQKTLQQILLESFQKNLVDNPNQL
jgi:hypothetical protein